MSAVYDDVKRQGNLRATGGFATMHEADLVQNVGENTSSSLGHYLGSAFVTGASVIYALHGDIFEAGERGRVLPVRRNQVFALVSDTHTSTMSIGGAWVVAEPEAYSSGVMNLPWARKVIHTGTVHFKTAELRRRAPFAIIGDLSPEENG